MKLVEDSTQSDEQLMDSVEKIGASMRRIRKSRGISQTELANRVGMRQPAITRLENGHHVPTWRTLTKIADALDAKIQVEVVASDELTAQ
jgi:transcriptional regulator with XRE-family HTH domain